jgi:hypothetical protein
MKRLILISLLMLSIASAHAQAPAPQQVIKLQKPEGEPLTAEKLLSLYGECSANQTLQTALIRKQDAYIQQLEKENADLKKATSKPSGN